MSVKRDTEGRTIATVYVPDDKLQIFFKKIDRYLTIGAPGDKPREKNLLESIAHIRNATLRGLWTDKEELYPTEAESIWWEVWLSTFSASFDVVVSRFRQCAELLNIGLQAEVLKLRDRAVLLAYGTSEQLSQSGELLGFMAEVRKAKATAEDITELPATEQEGWIRELFERITPASEDAPAVCVLDTGVIPGHPLLSPCIPDNGVHAYDPTWGTEDHTSGPFAGHGTEMSGLCLYGDLLPHILSSTPIQLSHQIESIKILPEIGANDPKLYGEIVRESVARVEVAAPSRNRVFSMAVTADSRDDGYPTSWSTAIDRIAFGEEDESKLIFVSAGNVPADEWSNYTGCNTLNGIQDPAQAWNVLTVGAFTNKISIPDSYSGYVPLARQGELSPTSCSSALWDRSDTPVKPEVVMEGGNIAIDGSQFATKLDSLSLLTTGHDLINAPLVPTCETSAAVSQVSRMGAILRSQYPHYRAETIRALIVHSAVWTPQMRLQFPGNSKEEKETLLRHCGYGVPSLDRAMFCATNELTLVIEEEIQPFEQGDSFHELNLHKLPWPKDALYELGDTPISMKVTLSYFVDALAGRRGFQGKFAYPSHRLGFKLKRVDESVEEFRARINRVVSDSGVESATTGTRHGWFLGPQLQTRGSIASDTWTGAATDLADSEVLAVFPKVGWWRSLTKQRCWNNTANYSLIVSISTPDEEVDLYTLVSNQLEVMTPVQIEVTTQS